MNKYYFLVIVLVFFQGCGITVPMRKSEKHLAQLNLGESKADAVKALGEPDRVRGSTKLPDGRLLELHEYDIDGKYVAIKNALLCPFTLTLSCWFDVRSDTVPYWLQYIDGKLDRWGRAGDWQPNVTADITIREK